MKRIRVSPGVVGRSLVAVLPVAVAAAALAQQLSITKTADSAIVSAGTQIGFTISVSNIAQAGSALDVTLSDPLPGGTGVSWFLPMAPPNCSITGAPPSQAVTCSPVNLLAGFTWNLHVVGLTSFGSCGTYNNTVSVTASNTKGGSRSASTTVQCPALSLTQTADAAVVDVGSPIGFKVTVANGNAPGTATASDLHINDLLPQFPGNVWTVTPPVAGCSMVVSADVLYGDRYRLHCALGSLAPGQSVMVPVVSNDVVGICNTVVPSPGHYYNTALLSGSNAYGISASALASVRCPGAPVITSANNAQFAPNVNNSFFVTATGTPAPTFGLAGALPAGVSLNAASGELHGMPSALDIGTWPLTLTAANGTVTDAVQPFALVVARPPCSLDIDDDAKTDAMTDGLMLMRAMLGMTGTPVTQGALGADAHRNTWGAIRDFLNTRCGTNFQ
jgi:uncharacterized repeat protein (TIGR01451 family)